MSWALRFEGVSKRYPVGGYRSLRTELTSRSTAALGPLALDDVTFEVAAGEAFALIGPNGAGKSTALRVAAQITAPTSGRVRVRGSVGALIEVGAGIHHELTGRENIYLYGTILGVARPELRRRFDEIVAFAELEQWLDVPVKRYSSGMQLRLGFAVAAGLEPDILVVDEALAVGDARFQVRCLDRMADLLRTGTTIVYVSHDLATVASLCRRGVLIVGGQVHHEGDAAEVLQAYLHWLDGAAGTTPGGALVDDDGGPVSAIRPGDALTVRVAVRPSATASTPVAIAIRDGHPWNLLASMTSVPAGDAPVVATCRLPSLPLAAGVYQVWTSSDADGRWEQIGAFRVVADQPPRPVWLPPVDVGGEWSVAP